MNTLTAREKVWSNGNGKLVADGDESACRLVAARGQRVGVKQVSEFENVSDFFDGLPAVEEVEKPKEPTPKLKGKATV